MARNIFRDAKHVISLMKEKGAWEYIDLDYASIALTNHSPEYHDYETIMDRGVSHFSLHEAIAQHFRDNSITPLVMVIPQEGLEENEQYRAQVIDVIYKAMTSTHIYDQPQRAYRDLALIPNDDDTVQMLVTYNPDVVDFEKGIKKIAFFENAMSAKGVLKQVKYDGDDYVYLNPEKEEQLSLVQSLLITSTKSVRCSISSGGEVIPIEQNRKSSNETFTGVIEILCNPDISREEKDKLEKNAQNAKDRDAQMRDSVRIYPKDAAIKHLASLGVRITLPGIDSI